MGRTKKFNEAIEELHLKQKHLILIKFTASLSEAEFIDTEFGWFKGKYCSVIIGCKNHPIRGELNRKEKLKQTMIKNHGSEHYFQTEKFKKENKEKTLKEHGCEYYSQTEECKLKMKETCNIIYGTDFASQNEDVKNKAKETSIKNHGFEHHLQNKDNFNKMKENLIITHGVENVSQLQEVKDKKKETMIENHGVNGVLGLPHVRSKIKDYLINNNIALFFGDELLKDIYKKVDRNICFGTFKTKFIYYGEEIFKQDFNFKSNKKSEISDFWLKQIENKLGYSLIKEYRIPETRYFADGFDPLTNTVYEFYGDFWHGNPSLYKYNILNKKSNKTFGELYDRTIARETVLKSLGYNLITIWENDFIKQSKSVVI